MCLVELPGWLSDKESTCCFRRCGFNPWVRKIPWRRKWQPTPVLLPGKSHGQRSLSDYSPWGCEESNTTWLATKHAHVGLIDIETPQSVVILIILAHVMIALFFPLAVRHGYVTCFGQWNIGVSLQGKPFGASSQLHLCHHNLQWFRGLLCQPELWSENNPEKSPVNPW